MLIEKPTERLNRDLVTLSRELTFLQAIHELLTLQVVGAVRCHCWCETAEPKAGSMVKKRYTNSAFSITSMNTLDMRFLAPMTTQWNEESSNLGTVELGCSDVG